MLTKKGFTLYELLITLFIASILATIGTPYLSSAIKLSHAQNTYYRLFNLIQYTRERAAFLHEDTLMCPSKNQEICINDWSLPIMVFVDNNRNKKRDKNEPIERIEILINEEQTLTWRASGTSRYLRFVSDGSTSAQNGSFRICPRDKNIDYARKIIIYMSGRARSATKQELSDQDCL